MNLLDAEVLARDLMTQHGVGGIRFKFHTMHDVPFRMKGWTNFLPIGDLHLPGFISLAKHYVEVLPVEEVTHIILHEIAHVKAGYKAAHGPLWEAQCIALGIPPLQYKSVSVRLTEPAGYREPQGWGAHAQKQNKVAV